GADATDDEPARAAVDERDDAAQGPWDDGLIARRVNGAVAGTEQGQRPAPETRAPASQTVTPLTYDPPLRSRLEALRELVGLSRTRLDSGTLAEAGRVLDEATARHRLSGQHTVVAIAGATGSGKSQLFNTLAGVPISETGVRRPTTAAPIACSWSDGAASLIERLGIPPRPPRRPSAAPAPPPPVAGHGGRGRPAARAGPGGPPRPRLGGRTAPGTGRPRAVAGRRRHLGRGPGEVRRRHAARAVPAADGGPRGGHVRRP